MKLVRDTLKSNLIYWFNVKWNPKYRPYLRKYEILDNPLWEHRKVQPMEGYYLCSFHSHTDGRSLPEFGRTAFQNRINLSFIMDHDSDEKFGGDLIKYYEFEPGKGVYLARGIECRCRDYDKGFLCFRWPKTTKMLIAMYNGKIKPKQPLEETVRKAKSQGALVFTASTLHTGATAGISRRNIEKLMSNNETKLDAIETLDAGYGFAGKVVNRHYWACAVAEYLADRYNIASIWSSNDHTNAESGVIGNFISKSDLCCLENPEEVLKNPNLLREQLKKVFLERRVIPAGCLSPVLSFLRPERLKILVSDARDSLSRKADNIIHSVELKR